MGNGSPTFVSQQQLADILGVSITSIRRAHHKGLLPYLKVGRQYRYELAEALAAFRPQDGR